MAARPPAPPTAIAVISGVTRSRAAAARGAADAGGGEPAGAPARGAGDPGGPAVAGGGGGASGAEGCGPRAARPEEPPLPLAAGDRLERAPRHERRHAGGEVVR